jgi:hypothetical protein
MQASQMADRRRERAADAGVYADADRAGWAINSAMCRRLAAARGPQGPSPLRTMAPRHPRRNRARFRKSDSVINRTGNDVLGSQLHIVGNDLCRSTHCPAQRARRDFGGKCATNPNRGTGSLKGHLR